METAASLGCLLPCESNTGEQNACWKKDVMKKCRQQLMDQRELLKEEEEEMEKKFEMIELFSDQVQRLVNEK
jgi:hypothetical protein